MRGADAAVNAENAGRRLGGMLTGRRQGPASRRTTSELAARLPAVLRSIGDDVPDSDKRDERHVVDGAPMLIILAICFIMLWAAVRQHGPA